MVQKWGIGGFLIVLAAILYVISLFMPWVSTVLFHLNGFHQEGYLLFILFIYPLYAVLSNKSMKPMIGLASSVFSVLFLVYYATSSSNEYMGSAIRVAGTGLYLAILAAVLFLTGIIIKVKKVQSNIKTSD